MVKLKSEQESITGRRFSELSGPSVTAREAIDSELSLDNSAGNACKIYATNQFMAVLGRPPNVGVIGSYIAS